MKNVKELNKKEQVALDGGLTIINCIPLPPFITPGKNDPWREPIFRFPISRL